MFFYTPCLQKSPLGSITGYCQTVAAAPMVHVVNPNPSKVCFWPSSRKNSWAKTCRLPIVFSCAMCREVVKTYTYIYLYMDSGHIDSSINIPFYPWAYRGCERVRAAHLQSHGSKCHGASSKPGKMTSTVAHGAQVCNSQMCTAEPGTSQWCGPYYCKNSAGDVIMTHACCVGGGVGWGGVGCMMSMGVGWGVAGGARRQAGEAAW